MKISSNNKIMTIASNKNQYKINKFKINNNPPSKLLIKIINLYGNSRANIKISVFKF